MKITILTLFPQMFEGPFTYSIIKRAQEKKAVEIKIVNIRDFGIGAHKTVDDTPYGGGPGMILKVDVLKNALASVRNKKIEQGAEKVILLDARGSTYNQTKTQAFSKQQHLIIICGHYEGFDERILDYVDEQISIGDFILTGGEIPAMAIVDSVVRLIAGVIKIGATDTESFSVENNYLEHPHYTRPEVYEGKKVPNVLLSGNHKEINEWRKKHSPKKAR